MTKPLMCHCQLPGYRNSISCHFGGDQAELCTSPQLIFTHLNSFPPHTVSRPPRQKQIAPAQSGRVPDLGIEVTGTHQRGQRGVEVTGVTGVALESGAEAGDVVVGVGWHARVDTAAGYGDAAARVRPGDLVTVDAYRNGRPIGQWVPVECPPYQNGRIRASKTLSKV